LVGILGAALLGVTEAAQWAVLVCGSRGYFNYRHHADVCHAYHLLRERGIPDENIITMMYDDVANSPSNPFPGQLFNKPSSLLGKAPRDVYKNCKKDYTGRAVTPAVFEKILLGDNTGLDKLGSGKVLKSTSEDEVFVNFVDHGAPGLIAFPSQEMFAKDLIKTIGKMKQRGMFKNLLFYMEACESGSMFKSLPKSWNVFAVTAANAKESSWATYCPPFGDKIQGKAVNTCLGDLFSVNWMEDTDSENYHQNETLLQQYMRVKKKTNKSHVQVFGDTKGMEDDAIEEFMGEAEKKKDKKTNPTAIDSSVDSRDVTFHSKLYMYKRNPTDQNKEELLDELMHRETTDQFFKLLASELLNDQHDVDAATSAVPPDAPTNWDCHKQAHTHYKRVCTGWTDYSLKYSATLLTLCEKVSTESLILALTKHCRVSLSELS